MSLAEKMLVFRAKHRISQVELAKMCGLSMQTISAIETEQQTPRKTTEMQILEVIEDK